MTFRDDFYLEQNIIGYTGELTTEPLPTIYFHDRRRGLFGHLCQHSHRLNYIGRTPVARDWDYLIFNSKAKDPVMQSSDNLGTAPVKLSSSDLNKLNKDCTKITQNNLIEYYFNTIKRQSKYPFIRITRADQEKRTILSEMLNNHKEIQKRFKDQGRFIDNY
ncbi:MAG: hypothetical protein KAH18_08250 [Psychromonas sp.]|nr:hypothetical protein [Psychromonas sp.]